jgi:hypothetical protein
MPRAFDRSYGETPHEGVGGPDMPRLSQSRIQFPDSTQPVRLDTPAQDSQPLIASDIVEVEMP